MGETVHHTVEQVRDHFRSRSRYSLAAAIILAVLGGMEVANTIRHIDANLAFFIIGVGCCGAAVTMIVGWGAADNQSRMAVFAAEGHENLNQTFCDRLHEIQDTEREIGQAIIVTLDEVRERRKRREG